MIFLKGSNVKNGSTINNTIFKGNQFVQSNQIASFKIVTIVTNLI